MPKKATREPPSTGPPSDARETSTCTNTSHSLTKDDIPTIVKAVIRVLPNTMLSQEHTPTGPLSPSEPQHENSSTGAQVLTDIQGRDHLPPPGESFLLLLLIIIIQHLTCTYMHYEG